MEYPEPQEFIVMQENTFLGQANILLEGRTPTTMACMASSDELDEWFSGIKYQTLLRCIAFKESSYNQYAVGDSGRAYGILQFHYPTFKRYCVGDYEDPRAQILCADKMISDNWNNINHWTTAYICIR